MKDTISDICTWGQYVELLLETHGGMSGLVDTLIHRARKLEDLPADPQTIERGIRRLATKEHGPGGQYGRWLLRFLGVPRSLEESVRWLGQYHSRFTDLPTSLCEAQLALWDRRPIIESKAAAWIHLGLAGTAMRRRNQQAAEARLRRAEVSSELAGRAATAEVLLLRARLSGDLALLERAESTLLDIEDPRDRACYVARIADQRAYRLLHQSTPDLLAAQALYRSIPEVEHDFVRFRRAHGLAYCSWKLGRQAEAQHFADQAIEAAGDAGLIRFRAMALELAGFISGEPRSTELFRRARALAQRIEHEDLNHAMLTR